jgi:hypothetical protein
LLISEQLYMAKTIGWIVGIVFLLVGLLGLAGTGIVGEGSLFHTNGAHDWVHIISGALFIILAAIGARAVPMALKIFGVVYLLVMILGFMATDAATGIGSVLGFVEVNAADNWLHLVLGLGMVLLGFVAGRDRRPAAAAPMA